MERKADKGHEVVADLGSGDSTDMHGAFRRAAGIKSMEEHLLLLPGVFDTGMVRGGRENGRKRERLKALFTFDRYCRTIIA